MMPQHFLRTPEQQAAASGASERVLCLGWATLEGKCERYTHGPRRDNPLWCDECDEARIEHLSGQFKKIEEGFRVPR